MSKEVTEIINTLCEKLGVAANILVPELAKYNIARLCFLTVVLTILAVIMIAVVVKLVKWSFGDEFEIESGKRFVIIKMDGTEVDRYIDEEGKTYCMNSKYKVMRKTGRHFPEIAEVLQKMREGQEQ